MQIAYLLSYNQAEQNMRALYLTQDNLQVDQQGSLTPIEWYNVPKRIFIWISDFLDGGSRIYQVYWAVLETFKKINDPSVDHTKWTFRYVNIKPFQIGFDKVAIRVLANKRAFSMSLGNDRWICNRIREEAYNTLSWVIPERKKLGIDYNSDHLK